MASTIPAVLDALTALFTAALPSNFQVGQATLIDVEPDYLIVGYDDGDQPAVTGSRAVADYGHSQDEESYDVENLLCVWVGAPETKAARDRLFGFLDLFDTALTASGRLGVTGVALARISDFAYAQPTHASGSMATLQFTVHVEAWT